jgi:hypothetical protein
VCTVFSALPEFPHAFCRSGVFAQKVAADEEPQRLVREGEKRKDGIVRDKALPGLHRGKEFPVQKGCWRFLFSITVRRDFTNRHVIRIKNAGAQRVSNCSLRRNIFDVSAQSGKSVYGLHREEPSTLILRIYNSVI